MRLLDYRDVPEDEPFDKIASVGMFEHVGRKNLPVYFGKIARLLEPGGLVLNHGITLNAPGQRELGSGIGEFIDDYVFPGGELAHVSQVIAEMSGQGLERCGRGKPAPALREHAVGVGRPARGEPRGRGRRGRREGLPHLAHLHGGLGARVRARLDVDLSGARGQAAGERRAGAAGDAR